MKEPSIHLTRTNLKILLNEYEKRHSLGIDIDKLVKYLLSNGSQYQIESRIPLHTTLKDQTKVVKGTMSTKDKTSKMALIIRNVRRADNRFKAPPLVKQGDAQWNQTREVAELASRFCEAYQLSIDDGFRRYIKIYMLIKTKGFNLSIFNARHEFICETYEAQVRLEDHGYKDEVERAHEKYQKECFERTGQRIDFNKNPAKYVCFLDGMIQAEEMNITPEDYIEAGWTQLSYKSGVPTVTGFGTDMYRNRVITWMAENNYQPADNTSAEDEYRATLKRLKENHEDSD